uniref:Uncharacterized protein n=1 Tax=Opuntia streptacantha TaxID=393608 RepID=A0A7C9D0Y1_OPUST
MCKLNCPPFSLTSILSSPFGGFISKLVTNLATISPKMGNANIIPGQLLLPTPNGKNLKSTFPPPTVASVPLSSCRNRSGRNSSGSCHHSGLFASHHALTTTLDSLGIVCPPRDAFSRFIWGTNSGIGVCSLKVSFIVACK